MGSAVWDQRYSAKEFMYGQEPNVFIASASAKYLKKPCTVVELASGEGRNVVHLAKVCSHRGSDIGGADVMHVFDVWVLFVPM